MPSNAVILAIETSQRRGSVAVSDPRGDIHQESLTTDARLDDDLLPAIDRLFRRVELRPNDLAGGAVAVSIGPGGFTGLRIAVSTAKMLAQALGPNLIAVPSAFVAAESCDLPGPILVALASKRETLWTTRLQRSHDGWSIVAEPYLAAAATLPLDNFAAVVADEHLPESVRERCSQLHVPIIEPRFEASACLRIARRMLVAGAVTDPLRLLPLYPREPEAVTLWEKRQRTTRQSPSA